MNKLILCEGETDAILLSYYLGQTCGWAYCKKAPKGLNISVDKMRGESANWYSKADDHLLICAVGSKDSFASFYDDKISPPLRDSDAFSKIALIRDRDQESVEQIEESIREALSMVASDAKNDQWVNHSYQNAFDQKKSLDFLLLIIPPKHHGALENLLLEAISEDPYDGNIVSKSRAYVEAISPEAERYIGKDRLKIKACLGVTWAIQSPQKVFRFIDEQIRSVKWETSEVLADCFRRLKEI